MFAREGYTSIFVTLIFALIVSGIARYIEPHWTAYLLYTAMALLVAFILYFFRDPDREITADENVVLSPADGNIVQIKKVDEDRYIKGSATQISIFLSPLNVHVNRIPVAGMLEYLEYEPGMFLAAYDHRASELNERADFGVKHPSGTKIFFRQITGLLARRIVYHIEKGDKLEIGKRFGMMKFGSRMDILVPPEVEVNVSEGEKAVAGKTILATINP
ncbi:phosphatidylserine decarboxylase family protein [Aliifodinibius salipaludis]|uniref:Phosphatidylserine decarboxylase proenzyme n=1 Tax=Fodinibius salipaludis TaxID=2032627 RepID=A0A2A2GAV1_9BACT|nr:phosphatidylserine decarboxylase family protein [Aliifodinibius salipaludis]PAU93983.1 phosphatidylserine decarboxylase family protein [Aliifodinibius salipaludis]